MLFFAPAKLGTALEDPTGVFPGAACFGVVAGATGVTCVGEGVLVAGVGSFAEGVLVVGVASFAEGVLGVFTDGVLVAGVPVPTGVVCLVEWCEAWLAPWIMSSGIPASPAAALIWLLLAVAGSEVGSDLGGKERPDGDCSALGSADVAGSAPNPASRSRSLNLGDLLPAGAAFTSTWHDNIVSYLGTPSSMICRLENKLSSNQQITAFE